MKCDKCLGDGLIALDRGGLTSMFCDCEAGKRVRDYKLGESGLNDPLEREGPPAAEEAPEQPAQPLEAAAMEALQAAIDSEAETGGTIHVGAVDPEPPAPEADDFPSGALQAELSRRGERSRTVAFSTDPPKKKAANVRKKKRANSNPTSLG